MYHIFMTVGMALLVGSILFISLGLFGKISPEPFSNMTLSKETLLKGETSLHLSFAS